MERDEPTAWEELKFLFLGVGTFIGITAGVAFITVEVLDFPEWLSFLCTLGWWPIAAWRIHKSNEGS